ncbi:ribosomal protein S18-alanine N-acetyltransferase [Novosphingobium colocasiae]|uniref:[Ribosomal protein bS18]-alanine N-acetyltransferase n=1 Tax=Novosphingobium colocasiae TaxID=1256513 RepID=A0A918PFC9_9SPHN|nr:ribosomal protein S18-alanine N-acetyltransferase [Novosphingobium colocasiae]GGZ06005.1 ribosomal-protein-alanine acetyltransferase [Novosphingobium colocasiae]
MMDDVDRIMAVMAAAFDPHYGEAWSRRQIEDALTLGNCHYLLIDAAEGPAGFALSRTGFEEEELLLLAVRPEFRGRGLGRSLLDHLEQAARKRGARRILLEMRRGNPAERLYSTFGFLKIGERKDYYRLSDGSRVDAITFAAALSPATPAG